MLRPLIAVTLALVGASASGCNKAPATTEPTAATPEQSPEGDVGGLPPAAPARSSMTAADCEAGGGSVVGDIGDGATSRPDYRCPESGEPPSGSIAAEPGEAIATDGAVCCPSAGG